MKITRGSTSVRRLIFVADTSKTDGSGLANLAHNTSGLVAYYFAGDLSNEVEITLASATLGAWTSGGFVAVDNTNMPGWYEIGIPNAALDGGNEVAIQLRGATNMAPVNVYIELDTVDYQTAAFGAASAVWNALLASYTVNGSFGARIMRTDDASAGNGAKVTGAGHVAADIHELQPAVITAAAFDAGAIDANALAADAVAEIQSGLATLANQTTIIARLGAFTGTGVNTVLGFLRSMASKAASTPSDIGGTYTATTDSLEAIRDAQMAGTGDASQATLEAVQDTVDAIAAKVSGGLIEVTSRVATGGNITLYIGDDARVRSGTEIEVTISDVGGTIYSRLDSLGIANLAWGASRRGLGAGAISGTISGLSQSGSGATQAATFVVEIDDAGDDLLPHDDYTWQIMSTSASGDEWVEVEGTLDLRRRVAVPI